VTNQTNFPAPTTGGADALLDGLADTQAFVGLGAAHIRARAAMFDAAGRNTTATGNALKWFAAFATAGLFALSQFLRLPSGALLPPAQAIGLIVSALGFLTTLLAASVFILAVELRVAGWLRNMSIYVASEESARATYATYLDQAKRAAQRGDASAAHTAVQNYVAAESAARIAWPADLSLDPWYNATVSVAVVGFLIGVFGAAADFAVKMASNP
jgi:hypothetical protein